MPEASVVGASDLVYRGFHFTDCLDFLVASQRSPNIVSNPPFRFAKKFVAHAMKLAERKVAMLLPANWVQGDKRSRCPGACLKMVAPSPMMCSLN